MEDRHGGTVATQPVEAWPPDDTEESVVGTNLHQETIGNLRWGLNEVASTLAAAGEPRPWQALSQTAITGLQHPDGSPYTVLPDVYIYAQPIDERRASLSLAADGPPLLVAEVLSPETSRWDLDLRRGKGFSYARAGVPEYLVLDPTGGERLRGWRLEEGVYRRSPPDVGGRWQSRVIPAAVAFEGVRVVVFSRDGRRQLREGEVTTELARRDRELAQKERELASKDEELAALRRRLEELAKGQ